ncbi:hypothetical protein [Nocardioides humi]|uniref:Immunity protein 35 n=1 Tax=Nocardioides humi TaxID=449461 RepID=A0ABN2A0Y6_9ACTN|nr:hypothetical protein [Nocardioides humi]
MKLRRRNRQAGGSTSAAGGGAPAAGEVCWWDLEASSKYEPLLAASFKAGRQMAEPDRPGTPAPACFTEAVAWVTELGASRVQAFHWDHRADVEFVVANNNLVHYYGELDSRLISPDASREFQQRLAASNAETARQVRGRIARYKSEEQALDYELSRLAEAARRLLSAMRGEFIRGWFHRDDIDMVTFPAIDPDAWKYSGHSGIDLGDAFDPLGDLRRPSPDALLSPEPRDHHPLGLAAGAASASESDR